MKPLILSGILCLAGLSVEAQFFNNSKVPEGIKINFRQQYPGAQAVHWSQGSEGLEVSFKFQRRKHFGLYAPEGAVIMMASELPKTKLPKGVRKQLKETYNDYVFEGAEVIKDANGLVYSTEVARAEEELSLVFDSEGRLRSVIPVEVR